MKKLILLAILVSIGTLSVYAATYKVNSNGTLTSPSGTVQSVQTKTTQPQVYNTYTTQNYTQNVQQNVGQAGIVEIIMDYSGSMSNWVSVMENSMQTIVKQLPQNIKFGLRVAGYGRITEYVDPTVQKNNGGKYIFKKGCGKVLATGGRCTSSEQVIPIAPLSSVNTALQNITTGGTTPLVYALQQAVAFDFAKFSYNEPKKIILITDGGENCGGDPCAFANVLARMRNDITIDVVLVSNDTRFKCLAESTGGNVYRPSSINYLPNVIINSAMNIPAPSNNIQIPQIQQPIQPQQVQPKTQNYEYIPD
ncbi:MAG: hypothetical protein MJ231_01440 [bacterium]|nr:hypothetical protein [bacterium]